jgi:hypothetical protein
VLLVCIFFHLCCLPINICTIMLRRLFLYLGTLTLPSTVQFLQLVLLLHKNSVLLHQLPPVQIPTHYLHIVRIIHIPPVHMHQFFYTTTSSDIWCCNKKKLQAHKQYHTLFFTIIITFTLTITSLLYLS